MSRLIPTAAFALGLASAAGAQPSLGVTGAEFAMGGFSQSGGETSFQADISVDVAITDYHGLQGDLAWVESGNGAVGRIGAHAYMGPLPGQKYGLFAFLGDVNDRSLTYGGGGIEGMFEVSDRAALGGFAGLGVGSVDGLDVIFAGVEGTFTASDTLRLDGGVQLTEYDEAGFRAVGTVIRANLRYAAPGQPLAVTAGLVQDLLTGPDGGAAETPGESRLSWTFGTTNSAGPTSRPFRTPDPFLPLIRRGIY